MAAASDKNSRSTADELRSYVERVARLEEEKANIAADIKDVLFEAAGRGFDKKAVRQMVKEHMMDLAERAKQRAHEAMCEVYRASLGMLDGMPLGEAARKRLEPEPEPDEAGEGDEPGNETAPAEPPRGAMSQDEIDGARKAGGVAAAAGEKIYANPFVAGDPRRAAWDEGWCQHIGSDGMDIPKAWRRAEKPKKPDEGAPPPPPEA